MLIVNKFDRCEVLVHDPSELKASPSALVWGQPTGLRGLRRLPNWPLRRRCAYNVGRHRAGGPRNGGAPASGRLLIVFRDLPTGLLSKGWSTSTPWWSPTTDELLADHLRSSRLWLVRRWRMRSRETDHLCPVLRALSVKCRLSRKSTARPSAPAG